MIEPEDFGCDWIETLSSVSHAARSPMHGAFWRQWHKLLDEREPRFQAMRPDDDPSDPTMTHTFEGSSSVPIGCHIRYPNEPPRAIEILLHGYDDPPTMAESIERTPHAPGVLVIAMRVRGYAGSRARVGDLKMRELGWITHGLEEPEESGAHLTEWVLSHTIADILLGVRAARDLIGESVPVYLRGESFGGGLAVIAAARACEMSCVHPEQQIDRVCVGLPTFGDWRWRLDRVHPNSPGAGGEVKRYLLASHEGAEGMEKLLDLFDAALHAEHLGCPALFKVALRDEVVPAPTQSAIYNAIGTPPGMKGRFVTRYGHFDGGLTDLRRHAMFERMSADFLDPSKEPMHVLAAWEDVMTHGIRREEASS